MTPCNFAVEVQKSSRYKECVIGRRKGRWVILSEISGNKHQRLPAKLQVRCDCGTEKILGRDTFLRGRSQSCGCLGKEIARQQMLIHGQTRACCNKPSPEYLAWGSMIRRCEDKQNKDYGGVGVTVCKRWEDFRNFLADMGRRPGPDYSLDRFPNPSGNYHPGNCRWANRMQQQRNKRNTIWVDYQGSIIPLAELAERFHIGVATMRSRLELGWTSKEATETPVKRIA